MGRRYHHAPRDHGRWPAVVLIYAASVAFFSLLPAVWWFLGWKDWSWIGPLVPIATLILAKAAVALLIGEAKRLPPDSTAFALSPDVEAAVRERFGQGEAEATPPPFHAGVTRAGEVQDGGSR